MTTVFIHGLGLIGGSLIRAIRVSHPQDQIIASDPNQAALDYALQVGVVDETTTGLAGAQRADFIILAGPVLAICQDLADLARMELKEGVVVTDVGSTKQAVLKAAQPLVDAGVAFVGGHPMAGSHKSGVQASRRDLVENAFYFLVPTGPVDRRASLKDLLSGTGAKWLTVTAEEHDYLVAQVSHLPHVIATALVNQTATAFAGQPLGERVAAGGFKSVTRIVASDPTMWAAIMATNRDLISQQLASYLRELQRFKDLIDKQDQAGLFETFSKARVRRNRLNQQSKDLFYDLFINIPDQVGAIAGVMNRLAAANVNVIHLQVLELRDEINGVLQLTFSPPADQRRAAGVLNDYEIIERGDQE